MQQKEGTTMPRDHEYFMRIALEEAARGKAEGNTAVGSIIVQDETVVRVAETSSTPPVTLLHTRKQ
jgi:tRNA(Arg) A34 adenosine deaminase TadA